MEQEFGPTDWLLVAYEPEASQNEYLEYNEYGVGILTEAGKAELRRLLAA